MKTIQLFILFDLKNLAMAQSKENLMKELRNEYLRLVKTGLLIQKKGDIKAYTTNAIQAEHIAQRLQAISRGN